ncbi:MAG: molybdopterin oxidoreductase family protein [Robiginitomaculum sp.]|nr:molybdopterin oxidoreductase family protein [Robiginitomaculum sp.]
MTLNPFATVQQQLDLSPEISDEVKTTTCYMCACRCGIRVHLKDKKIRYIEGNPEHPVNKGVLCAKGAAGILNQYSPAKLTKPLLRVGERGEGKFKEIEWDEALKLATKWLGDVRAKDPSKLAFFTGRDQSQSLTGWWAKQFGTRNFAAHGGFCSVNMAAGGIYTLGGSFWEFGEPDWELTKYFMMFGVAEDHDSNPIKIGLGKLKTRGDAKFVAVNPSRNGYNSIADEWIGIRPGTDGLFVFALIHELLRAEKVDFKYLARYSNAPWLVIQNPGEADDGLILRNKKGDPLCYDLVKKRAVSALGADISPALVGEHRVKNKRVVPAFQLLAKRYLADEYSPDAVAETTGVPASTIRRIAAELAQVAFEEEIVIEQPWTDVWGRRHEQMIGRPVSFHAMRGISAHSNGFHTCRAIHILQVLLGSVDVPGGWRNKAPYPKPIPPGPKPSGEPIAQNMPLEGMPLGTPTGPEDLIVGEDGEPLRIDKAYSWEYPLSAHGLMHMVMHNAWAKDPCEIEVAFFYMANIAWNSSMNTSGTLQYFTDKDENGEYKIPKIIYSDAFWSETVAYSDLILPDTTYFERHDCISLLDRPISSAHGPGDAIRHPVLELDRDVRCFQTVLLDLGAKLGLPGFVNEDGAAAYPGGYEDYMVNHERAPGLGPLAGWRGVNGDQHGRGAPNKDQLQRYIENGGFWVHELPPEQQYFKTVNKDYLEYAVHMGWIPDTNPIIFQLYSEPVQKFRLSSQGHGKHQPPERHKKRVETYFDPLPFWYMPFEEAAIDRVKYPLHALSQRPMHMYHSWGSQNAWLRQITSANQLHMHVDTAKALGIPNGDWVWIESPLGRVKGKVKLISGVNPNTVWTWNAIGKRKGSWGLSPDAPESNQGFLLNHIISEVLTPKPGEPQYSNSDPVTGQAAWFDLRVRVYPCAADEAGFTEPMFERFTEAPAANCPVLRYGADLKGQQKGSFVPEKSWIGNRHENAAHIDGLADGKGNQTDEDKL